MLQLFIVMNGKIGFKLSKFIDIIKTFTVVLSH